MMSPPSPTRRSPARPRPLRWSWVLAASLAAGCTGQVVGEVPGAPAKPRGPGGAMTGPQGSEAPVVAGAPASGQRLTDRQYLNVVVDLFGVDATAEAISLPLDPKLEGFRNA